MLLLNAPPNEGLFFGYRRGHEAYPKLEGPMDYCNEDTYVQLRIHVEHINVIEWLFVFWNYESMIRNARLI